jgi:hypothetical protein
MDKSWDAQWEAAAAVGQDRWTAELAIPWELLGGKPKPGDGRRANLSRNRYSGPDEAVSWTQMWKSYHDVQFYGIWTFAK